eukprot:2019919-Prymnesium_polylepis.1
MGGNLTLWMAGDADSESGCDEGARAASSFHLAAEGWGGEKPSRCESWMKLDLNGRRGAQNVPTRGAKGKEISVKWY